MQLLPNADALLLLKAKRGCAGMRKMYRCQTQTVAETLSNMQRRRSELGKDAQTQERHACADHSGAHSEGGSQTWQLLLLPRPGTARGKTETIYKVLSQYWGT